MDLKYVTRQNISPLGKSKVYFCCCPADTEYLPHIANLLLKYQDCAVYYQDFSQGAAEEKELKLIINAMQLIVIPVTEAFLSGNNTAFDFELPYAINKHIPVLPLLQDGGLAEEFNRKCGKIQYLEEFSTDLTTVFFEEKLEKFLNAVFLNDTEIKRIRAAFDAYVFLSYRKKDRAHAQELMRLIHSNEACRDIAIWYDEFLTPGEHFDTEIENILKSSDLFTLLVTPNLINEPNYVQEIEYPLAQSVGKTVLAAESVPTDPNELYRQFPNLPNCVDAHNGNAIASDMLRTLNNIATRENDTPEHDYLIGLAYWFGTDVERNGERGLSLIRDAANRGSAEAMNRLVDIYYIYYNGKGELEDISNAIHWQEKYVESLKNNHTATRKDAIQCLFSAQTRLISLYDELEGYHFLHHTWEILKQKTTCSEKIEKLIEENIALAQTGEAEFKGAFIRLLASAYTQAGEFFCNKAFKLLTYGENITNAHILLNSAIKKNQATISSMQAAIKNNDISAAMEIAKKEDAWADTKLGVSLLKEYEAPLKKGVGYFNQALLIEDELLKKDDHFEDLIAAAKTKCSYAQHLLSIGNNAEKALPVLQSALAVWLIAVKTDERYIENLALTYDRTGECCYLLGKYDEALEVFGSAHALYKQLCSGNHVPKSAWLFFTMQNLRLEERIKDIERMKAQTESHTTKQKPDATDNAGIHVGDVVSFGNYWQYEKDGKEPIEWKVLYSIGEKTLLLSTKILEACEDNHQEWENSEVRKCSEDFYETAFNDDEKRSVLPLYNDSEGFHHDPVIDRVFILSADELGLSNNALNRSLLLTNPSDLHAVPTRYAYDKAADMCKKNNDWTYWNMMHSDNKLSVMNCIDGDADWWVRDLGSGDKRGTVSNGQISYFGKDFCYGLRPAVWVYTKKEPHSLFQEGSSDIDDCSAVCAGDPILFGTYPQNKQGPAEPIRWIVLAKENNRLLLLSEKVLISQPFCKKPKNKSWNKSSVRKWLNKAFYKNAFNKLERKHIANIPQKDSKGRPFGTSDPVFLLSWAEAQTYFPTDFSRQAFSTAFAGKENACNWVLLDLHDGDTYDYIDPYGKINTYIGEEDAPLFGVRPAIWVTIR